MQAVTRQAQVLQLVELGKVPDQLGVQWNLEMQLGQPGQVLHVTELRQLNPRPTMVSDLSV